MLIYNQVRGAMMSNQIFNVSILIFLYVIHILFSKNDIQYGLSHPLSLTLYPLDG